MFVPYLASFIDYLTYEKKYSGHTVQSYQTDLEQFSAFLGEPDETFSISEVNYQQIRKWVTTLMDSGLSPKSVNRKLSALKSFFKYLQKNGEIAVNPMARVSGPKNPKRLPEFVDESAMRGLLDGSVFEDGFKGMTDRLMIDLFYQAGLRRSELARLREEQVDRANATIRVLGKRNKERMIPVSVALMRNLEAYLQVKQGKHISNPMLLVNEKGKSLSEAYIYQAVRTYLGNVTTLRKRSPHVLRHTFATHLLDNGADINAVKDLLGHSSLAATQVYTHNTIDKLKKSYKQAHPRGDA